ncbi:MAG TPA: tetratricopeptide repeat protein [Bacteroidota bacterium]
MRNTAQSHNVVRSTVVLFAFLLLLCPRESGRATSPATVDWAAVHALTVEGINQLYNMDIDGALRTFERVTAMAPGDPRGHFFRSMVYFWVYNLQRDESAHEHFMALADTVIDVCESVLEGDENNAAAHFFLGGIYGYRGLAYQTAGSLLKAVYDGRKGYKNLEEAARLDTSLHDADMGLGLFRYLVAKAPRHFSWVFSILGFSGDLDGGLALLRAAADRGTYARTEAMYFLATFLFNENRSDEAFRQMDTLTSRFPDNTLFLITEANWYRRLGKLEEALALCQRAVAVNERAKLKYGEEFAYSTLAAVQYSLNDFPSARENFAKYMSTVSSRSLMTNWILYRYGVTLEMAGDRAHAVEVYRMNRQPDKNAWANEPFFRRKCMVQAERPLSPADIDIIKGNNELSRLHHEAAQQLFEKASQEAQGSQDALAEALFGIQQCQFNLGRYDESAATGGRVVGLSPPGERWVVPHAWLKLGQAEAKLGKTDEARNAFKRVEDYDGYDYQEFIEEHARQELDRLK